MAEPVDLRIDAVLLRSVREPFFRVLCRPTVLAFHLLLVAGFVAIWLLAKGTP